MRQRIRSTLIFISFLLFPVTIKYLSPYLSVWAATQGFINASLLVFAALFLISLVLGRAFCGWICPGGGLQDACKEINPGHIKRGRIIKWIIWVPWFSSMIYFILTRGATVKPLFMMASPVSINSPVNFILYYGIVLLIFLPAIFAGKRSFCHHICWMAPFMIIGEKVSQLFRIPRLKIKSVPEKCKVCKICDRECPMSITVTEELKAGYINSLDCIACGVCVDRCKFDALSFSMSSRSSIQ